MEHNKLSSQPDGRRKSDYCNQIDSGNYDHDHRHILVYFTAIGHAFNPVLPRLGGRSQRKLMGPLLQNQMPALIDQFLNGKGEHLGVALGQECYPDKSGSASPGRDSSRRAHLRRGLNPRSKAAHRGRPGGGTTRQAPAEDHGRVAQYCSRAMLQRLDDAGGSR